MARTRISVHGFTLAQLRALDRACQRQLENNDTDNAEWECLLHARAKISDTLRQAEGRK